MQDEIKCRLIELQLAETVIVSTPETFPFHSTVSKDDFHPMDRIVATEELLWTLEYIQDTYRHKIPFGCLKNEKYLLQIDECTIGHPVFLLGTLYALLVAGADIYVMYSNESERLWDRIVSTAVEKKLIKRITPDDIFYINEKNRVFQKYGISNLVLLGDSANSHREFRKVEKMLNLSVYHPSAHLLIADYSEKPEYTQAHARFANKCWYECIDYQAYRANTNQVPDISLGFDFGDLFWGADAVVNTWNDCIGLSDKVPAIIFTDRTKEDVWLPAGTEKCCNVIFFDEYDCDYPLYDFTQLIKRPDQE